MARRRGAGAVGLAFTLVFSAGLFAQEFEKKQDEAMKKEAESLSKLAEGVLPTRGGPNDFSVTWVKEDFLRTSKGKVFVPFTITLDPTKVGETVMVYWRVVPQAASAAAAAAGKNPKKVDPVLERASLVSFADAATNPVRLNRSFEAQSGVYDVYVVMKEIPSEKAPRNSPAPKTVVLKQSVTVPDFWNDELATSSVIVYERIEPLAAPLNQQQQLERPYAMGTAEIVPYADLKLPKRAELSTLMFVYNPKGDSANKPDVTVEYNFCQAAPGNQPQPNEPCKAGEKFYNKTDPIPFNAQTVDPQFDVKQHQIQAGQGVPLSGFPVGDYRLEIKITDKLANKTITRDVNFSVTAS